MKYSEKKIKVALIGAGNWGLQYARIYATHTDVDFCAIVGRSLEKTKARAEQFGTRFYLNIEEMLEKENPDFVSMCLPSLDQFEATLKVIQAGYPLLVEKPLVFNLDEADILIKEAEERKLFFAINFNHRYARPVEMAYQAIREGKLGELVFLSWRFGGEGKLKAHPHANLIEAQCHGFDMLEHLCGPVESVMAEMTDKTGKGFSTMIISLKFSNGAVGSFIGTYDSSYAYKDTHRVEVNGTEGRVLITDTVRSYEYQPVGSETSEVWQAGYFNDIDRDFRRTFDKHVNEILLAFREGKAPPVHATYGRRALLLAHATIESFQSGKRILIKNT